MPIKISRSSATTVQFSTPQEIVISHADDSIRVGDGTDLLAVNTDGSVNTRSNSCADTDYVGGLITVTTSQVECKVGSSRLANRRMVYIENRAGSQIFYGPSGVTTSNGARLTSNQSVFLNIGPNIAVYVIKGSGSGAVVVQEFS